MRPDVVLPLAEADHTAQHIPRMNTNPHVDIHSCSFSHLPMEGGGYQTISDTSDFLSSWRSVKVQSHYTLSAKTETHDHMRSYPATANKYTLNVDKRTKNDFIQYLLSLNTL